jgi:peptide/nickel transport system substrate-binding protein
LDQQVGERLTRGELIRRGTLLGSAALLGGGYLAPAQTALGARLRQQSDTPRRGGIATISYTDASTSDKLDPARLAVAFEVFAGGLLYDNLVAVDADNQPIPALAESWHADSTLTRWVFDLRKGVEFHDGRPFTSADAEFTVSRVLDPKLGSGATALFAGILKPEGIRQNGAHQIEFTLQRPNAFLPVLLSTYFMRVLPAGITLAETNKGIGTGAFKLDSFQPGTEMQVSRNPHYWKDGKPYLDGINVSIVFDPTTKLESVLTGNADVGDAIEYSALPLVQSSPNAQLIKAAGANFGTFSLYQKKSPGNDLIVRQAIKYGLDRQKILETVYFGAGAVSADVSIPPTDPYYPHDVKPFPHDPEQAKALLKKAGYPNGLTLTLYASSASPGMADSAVALQQILQPAGINLGVQMLPNGTYYSTVTTKPFFCDFWLRQHVAYSLPLLYGTGGLSYWNETQFSNHQVDQLIGKLQSSSTLSAQKQAIADAYSVINRLDGENIACHADRVWIAKPNVQGLALNPGTIADFSGVYLT